MLYVALTLLLAAQQTQQLPRPTFETGVDVVLVDVHVVDKQGKPILDLQPADFEVQVSGKRRPISSMQLVDYGGSMSRSATVPATSAEPTPPRPRRMYVLAVDEHSLHVGNAVAAINAAQRFIDRLQPDDLIGLHAYPTGTARHDFTTDHASVRRELRKITGLFEEPSVRFNLSPSEVIDIASGDRETLLRVHRRECPGGGMGCSQADIRQEAIAQASFMEMKVSQSVGGLRALVRGLGDIPGRKILVMVSGGLISTDRSGGRANASMEIRALGKETALANISVFALHLDWSFIAAQSSRGGLRTSFFRDSNLAATGLEEVAGTAGGAVIRVFGTAPDAAFDRVASETSAHYLLGVESHPDDKPGETHTIRVTVKRRGAQVRSRTQFIVPAKK
jgi:VWFA-related protein